MGLLSSLMKRSGRNVLQLDILMDYSITMGSGLAALRWTPLVKGEPLPTGVSCSLVALLYGQVLCIHDETRSELFHRVQDLSIQYVRAQGNATLDFSPWTLHVGIGGGNHALWPWTMVPPDQIISPKAWKYSAYLKADRPNSRAPLGRWIYVDMPLGLERVLVPSSALIAISGFMRSCTDSEERLYLALLLSQMNAYWGSPERISFKSEAIAYAAAHSAIESSRVQLPPQAS